jgi:hypothetical protein
MEPRSDSDAPTLDKGVLERLKRLDPKLKVTFCKYAIDQVTGEPIEVNVSPDWLDDPDAMSRLRQFGKSRVVLDPAWHLWSQDPDGRWILINSYAAAAGFGHREVAKLEGDVARYMRPSDLIALMWGRRKEHERKAKKDHKELRSDIHKANKSRIHDLLFEDKPMERDGKFMSGPGLNRRGNMGTVLKDDKEDGWEKPDPQ